MTVQPPMALANLPDPTIRLTVRSTKPGPALHHVDPTETLDAAEAFIAARTTADPLVALAYGELERQTDRQYKALTDPSAPYRLTDVSTGQVTPFRAVHDLVGHVATGFGFDKDGEYSARLVQRSSYTGLARWAARTELHAEISALWTTGQFADHKAALLETSPR